MRPRFPATLTFTSPRAWAFSILGMQAYLDWFPGDRVIQGARNALANRLLDIYERTHSETWKWFEKSLSYSNARLSQALITRRMAERQPADDRGWHAILSSGSSPSSTETMQTSSSRSDPRDSSPKEARRLASINNQSRPAQPSPRVLQAYRLTEEKHWLEEAWCAFRWFLGENDLQVPLYDATTGGCKDGLHPDRVNENQGAESTLSFLMALLEMQEVRSSKLQKNGIRK